MAGRKSDFTLTKLEDLFTTQAQRDEEQFSNIRDIPLELIDEDVYKRQGVLYVVYEGVMSAVNSFVKISTIPFSDV